jgi:predicted nucleic acid-binding protein
MRLVVDTNIVFSAILNSQSRIGQMLLLPERKVKFYKQLILMMFSLLPWPSI